jgi:hypothetical protein
LNVPSEYVIRKVSAKQKGLKFNETHLLPVPTFDVNLLEKNVRSIKNAEDLLV